MIGKGCDVRYIELVRLPSTAGWSHAFLYHRTDRPECSSSNCVGLFEVRVRFESRPEYWLLWVCAFLVYLDLFCQLPAEHITSKPFSLIVESSSYQSNIQTPTKRHLNEPSAPLNLLITWVNISSLKKSHSSRCPTDFCSPDMAILSPLTAIWVLVYNFIFFIYVTDSAQPLTELAQTVGLHVNWPRRRRFQGSQNSELCRIKQGRVALCWSGFTVCLFCPLATSVVVHSSYRQFKSI
jgi:hypothetical protein